MRNRTRSVASFLAMTLTLLALSAGILACTFGSTSHALAYLRGRIVVTEPAVIDLGQVSAGSHVERVATVTNLTRSPVRVVGYDSDGPCSVLDRLPVDIPPRASRRLTVAIGVGYPGEGDFAHALHVFIDEGESVPKLAIIGRVVRPPGTAEPPLAQ